jgi:hypothetical protein
VFLFGFSRGAFAARSLAGFVDAVGLLLRDHAGPECVEEAYALYESGADPARSRLREFLNKMTGAERPEGRWLRDRSIIKCGECSHCPNQRRAARSCIQTAWTHAR